MPRLYLLHRCPFGHRAAFALREKKLDVELVFFEAGKRPPELAAVSPRAKSPTLFDGDARVYESSVVLEYLEDRYPQPALLPASAQARADVRMLIARWNDEVVPKFGALIAELLFKPERDQAKIAAARQALLAALPAWNEHFAGRTFAVGDALSLADITLYTFFPALEAQAGVTVPQELTQLRAFVERMAERPASALPAPS